ncbi:MAG: hypothetical protein R3E68_04325 [Burkholderiaceae bacterium]
MLPQTDSAGAWALVDRLQAAVAFLRHPAPDRAALRGISFGLASSEAGPARRAAGACRGGGLAVGLLGDRPGGVLGTRVRRPASMTATATSVERRNRQVPIAWRG